MTWAPYEAGFTILEVDSISILFSHLFLFQELAISQVFGGFLERRIPGKNGEVSPTTMLRR